MNMLKVTLNKKTTRKLDEGYPWIFKTEVEPKVLSAATPGQMAEFYDVTGERVLATGFVNPASTIFGRVLGFGKQVIGPEWIIDRLRACLQLRAHFFTAPFYRLVHAESDGLPGLIIDRFDHVFVMQVNTYGIANFQEKIVEVLLKHFGAKTVILKNDSPVRKKEGLPLITEVRGEPLPENHRVIVQEGGCEFEIDVITGQKSGWFYDQRANRAFVAHLAKNKTVLDGFCYLGGFGIQAMQQGAKSVVFIDSSQEAIEATQKNCILNKFDLTKPEFINEKVFQALSTFQQPESLKKFELVCLDPPAFIKAKLDMGSGLRGYEKLAKMAAPIVEKAGTMVFSSCSHHAHTEDLIKHIYLGIKKAGREARLVRVSGADVDHPVHPMLKESEYLKCLVFQFID
jgi:23S rRNA (cytosine1962-C5)-methyltransferase